jgi:hypothetical protein
MSGFYPTEAEKELLTGDVYNYQLRCAGCGSEFNQDFDEVKGATQLSDVDCPNCWYINFYDLDADGEAILPPMPDEETKQYWLGGGSA